LHFSFGYVDVEYVSILDMCFMLLAEYDLCIPDQIKSHAIDVSYYATS